MALTFDEQKQVVRNWVRENFVRPNAVANQHGGDILAAVQALDAYFDANAATINASLPEPFKTQATAAQKASLMSELTKIRWGG